MNRKSAATTARIFGNEGERHLLDLRHRLKDRHRHPGHETEDEHGTGHEQRHEQRALEQDDRFVGGHRYLNGNRPPATGSPGSTRPRGRRGGS